MPRAASCRKHSPCTLGHRETSSSRKTLGESRPLQRCQQWQRSKPARGTKNPRADHGRGVSELRQSAVLINKKESPMTEPSIPAETRIGHIHLKVADLERAIGFYRDYLGFDLLFNIGSAAFLSAGGYHHHIGLNTWESKDGQPPAPGTTGLYHFAINYPTRRDLEIAVIP